MVNAKNRNLRIPLFRYSGIPYSAFYNLPIAMAQWVNRLRNKIFVKPLPLPLLCEISGALHLAQPGLTEGWPSGWQTKYR